MYINIWIEKASSFEEIMGKRLHDTKSKDLKVCSITV